MPRGLRKITPRMLKGAGLTDQLLRRKWNPQNMEPLGAAPSHLTPAQKAVWEEIASDAPPGVLFRSDRATLELAAVCMEELRRVGVARLASDKLAHLRMALSDLGLTPVDRSKLVFIDRLEQLQKEQQGAPKSGFDSL